MISKINSKNGRKSATATSWYRNSAQQRIPQLIRKSIRHFPHFWRWRWYAHSQCCCFPFGSVGRLNLWLHDCQLSSVRSAFSMSDVCILFQVHRHSQNFHCGYTCCLKWWWHFVIVHTLNMQTTPLINHPAPSPQKMSSRPRVVHLTNYPLNSAPPHFVFSPRGRTVHLATSEGMVKRRSSKTPVVHQIFIFVHSLIFGNQQLKVLPEHRRTTFWQNISSSVKKLR